MLSNFSDQTPPTRPSSDSSIDAITAWNSTKPGCGICIGITDQMARPVTRPTTMPRVMPPKTKPLTSSIGDSGGIRMSTMLPWTLAITMEEEVLAKAFCTIAIMIRPGARNCR